MMLLLSVMLLIDAPTYKMWLIGGPREGCDSAVHYSLGSETNTMSGIPMALRFKKGDPVVVVSGSYAGRHGVVDRLVLVRTEAERRAGQEGRVFFDVDIAGEVCRFLGYFIKKVDILDVLADQAE